MSRPDNRKRVFDVDVQPVGMFAVMRHTSQLKRAHFTSFHDSYESASGEAVRLLSESASHDPHWQHTYYVLEVAAFFSAGKEGLRSAEKKV